MANKWNILLVLVFINALAFSLIFNELNLIYIRSINPENSRINAKSLVHNSTVWSIDNEWYLPYALNLKEGYGFTSDRNEPEMRVRRTPVYPLFYAMFYLPFGEENAHFLIRYIQVIFFAFSALLMALMIKNIFKNEQLAIITGLIYGANVFIFSNLYFTITEALFPSLVVFTAYIFSLFVKSQKRRWLLICGMMAGIAFLCRATTGLVLAGIGIYILTTKGVELKQKVMRGIILTLGFLLLITPWVIRNYKLTGELIIAEKYYHGATMSFGRSHIKLRELVGTWTNPANLSVESFSNQLIENEKSGNSEKNSELIDTYLSEWPEYVFEAISKISLKQDLMNFSECLGEKEIFKKNNPGALRKDFLNLDCENEMYRAISLKKDSVVSKFPLRYYILTPLTSMKELVFNSFVHGFALVTSLNTHYYFVGIALKSVVYIFHVLLYLSLFYFMICEKLKINFKLFVLLPIALLMILLTAFLFRYIESRYLLPIYPLLTISFAYSVYRMLLYLDRRKKVNQKIQ